MKRILITLPLLLLLCFPHRLTAGTVDVKDFRRMRETAGQESVRVYDPNGRPCAVIRFSAPGAGWTFEAGTWGVMEVLPAVNGIDVYLPADAKTLTVAHPSLGRSVWMIPEPLVEGAAYCARIEKMKEPVAAPRPAPRPSSPVSSYSVSPYRTQPLPGRPYGQRGHAAATRPPKADCGPRSDGNHFPTEFLDFYAGFADGESICGGFRYTHLQNRVGGYISLGSSIDDTFMLTGGLAFRLFSEDRSGTDFQWTVGVGVGDCFAFETGVRFAFKGEFKMSGLDFGAGIQVYDGVVVPIVEVGLIIWGIPLVCALGLCL